MTVNNPWFLCITGICFCLAGGYSVFKNIYEDDRSIRWGVILIVMGVVLITAGAARFFRFI
ncbi:MAG TPA: hypothetical protein PKC69_05640 [Chitinophagaceae bacterium]|nr:hypothetical protein [Chitinophagaceae bacterium]